ncbi:hypothetical protein GCM10010123_05770 [Pilimelia anulata]|uniref:Uncharacterized protein n=1 Tax=Pilimelia anulata TaxID=53371 RepID=A0A8J3FAX9_9ACTN|nr:hypothetical protein [Pilimelia anulata]GGJ78668.1 hypothetical protein GCM10010123_05770 [Pilimelia anulata]
MFAILAAVLFGIAAIVQLFGLRLGGPLGAGPLTTLGLLCVALHLAGVGAGWRAGRRGGGGGRRW